MKLLAFAHRGEASIFLQSMNFKQMKASVLPELYQSDDMYLLITGEGIENALTKTSIALSELKANVSKVYNIGICGSIHLNEDDFQRGEIISVRTVFCQREEVEFKSFTSSDPNAKHDLITVNKRVLSSEQTSKLAPLAPYVDREAWAIAYATQNTFKLPIQFLKLVSDNANFESDFCQRIKDISEEYSFALFQHFNQLINSESDKDSFNQITELPNNLSELYFTQAQKNLFFSMAEKLGISPESVAIEFSIEDILLLKKTPKEKTKLLLENMQKAISPIMYDLRQRITQFIRKSESNEIKYYFDHNLEDENIKVQFQYKSEEDLIEKIAEVKKFPINKFQEIFQGNI